MATRIQSLYLVQGVFTEVNTASWLDGIAWDDAAGAPIPLDGIAFTAVFRAARNSTAAYLGLASPGAPLFNAPGVPLPPAVPRGLILTTGNVMGLYAPFDAMDRPPPAGTYLFDVIAEADGIRRRVLDGTLNLIQGLTA